MRIPFLILVLLMVVTPSAALTITPAKINTNDYVDTDIVLLSKENEVGTGLSIVTTGDITVTPTNVILSGGEDRISVYGNSGSVIISTIPPKSSVSGITRITIPVNPPHTTPTASHTATPVTTTNNPPPQTPLNIPTSLMTLVMVIVIMIVSIAVYNTK